MRCLASVIVSVGALAAQQVAEGPEPNATTATATTCSPWSMPALSGPLNPAAP